MEASAPRSPVWAHTSKLPIQSVAVVGAGGSGSIFISHLCRIWQAWTKLGGEPFTIRLFDDDVVSESNLARQCFCEEDIGLPKATVLAQRMRAFYGIPIEANVQKFKSSFYESQSDVVVGCVDNIAARKQLQLASKKQRYTRRQWGEDSDEETSGCYWLDLGNTMDAGQVVLGGHGLPTVFDLYPKMARSKDPKDLPSCSMAEALARQDLFINSTLATLAGQLLWSLMRRGGINHHGFIVNLASGMTLPIKCHGHQKE